jgi:hypothetical protein
MLGTTSKTAFRGDYGNSAYTDTQAATNNNTINTIMKRDGSGGFKSGKGELTKLQVGAGSIFTRM